MQSGTIAKLKAGKGDQVAELKWQKFLRNECTFLLFRLDFSLFFNIFTFCVI